MKMHDEEIFNSSLSFRLRRCAFTLIEMLVVVAIILILAGMTLKIIPLVTRKTGQVATLRILEQVKNALGGFYATYGVFPPVNSVYYEYEGTPMSSLPITPTNTGYSTGLVYYIYNGAHHNQDAEVARWQHYLKDVGSSGWRSNGFANTTWTNNTHTINDSWGSQLRYSNSPDHQWYKLWSIGANGIDEGGNGDDVGVTAQD
ncbi:MAG: prepilin-type N-terminal cleavage/methylation domain-containing protein [bacterium]